MLYRKKYKMKEVSWRCFKFRITKVALDLFLKSSLFLFLSKHSSMFTKICFLFVFTFTNYSIIFSPSSIISLNPKNVVILNILCLLSTSTNMLASLDDFVLSIGHNNALLKAIIILKEKESMSRAFLGHHVEMMFSQKIEDKKTMQGHWKPKDQEKKKKKVN